MKYDAVVVGGGPAGYTTAIRIAQLGGKAALVEKDALGGVCTNRGCIPTKTMWSVAKGLDVVDSLDKRGVTVKPSLDFKALMKWKDRVVKTNVKGIEKLLESNGVEVINDVGGICRRNVVEVGCSRLECRNIVIATGSTPRELSVPAFDHEYVLSSEDILGLAELPSNLLVVGGGVIGVEYAAIFSRLGSRVTVVEVADRLLPMEDADISAEVERTLGRNATIHVKSQVRDVNKKTREVQVKTPDKTVKVEADAVMVAVGRRPDFNRDELDYAEVRYDEKGVKVDSRMKTTAREIYAVGDVAGGLQLAHVASAEGVTAAENIMNLKREMNYEAIPWCIFSLPEVARVGLTSEEAGKKHRVLEGVFPYSTSGKSRCEGSREGFVKVILDEKSHRMLGVHIVGENASDLISEAALAVNRRMKAEDLLDVVHPHPTYPEMIVEAVLDALGIALNLPKK
jgi:dihydrolipoamide dehydrogenase